MERQQPLITYLLTFIIFAVLLKLLGIIDFANTEILSYAFIFYGISSVYISLGKKQKLFLFSGTIVFLIGLLLFIINNFTIFSPITLILPASLLMLGIAFLMLFIDEQNKVIYLLISIIFLLFGLVAVVKRSSFKIITFLESIWHVTKIYWPIIIVVALILLVIRRSERKDR